MLPKVGHAEGLLESSRQLQGLREGGQLQASVGQEMLLEVDDGQNLDGDCGQGFDAHDCQDFDTGHGKDLDRQVECEEERDEDEYHQGSFGKEISCGSCGRRAAPVSREGECAGRADSSESALLSCSRFGLRLVPAAVRFGVGGGLVVAAAAERLVLVFLAEQHAVFVGHDAV